MQASQQLNRHKFFSRASSGQRLIAMFICMAIIVFFAFFALVGRYNLDMGRWLGECGFKQRTGLPCPTCGMTTATLAFSQGHIVRAFYIQPACALMCSIMAITALIAFFVSVSGIYFGFIRSFFKEVKVRYIIIALVVIIAAGWAVTLARAVMENR